jgi:hypothetical protein
MTIPRSISRRSSAAVCGLAFVGIYFAIPAAACGQAPAAPEELARGPIHEAFGEPIMFDPKPGMIVSKQPPAPVDEAPTDMKPEGDNDIWIAGYWFWDDQRQDFIWVSGFWRAVPPSRTWMPGYWADLGDGRYEWVGGYWASTATTEVQYLPEPPATLEAGPSTDPPSAVAIWAPGCWVWRDSKYLWRPGFWVNAYPDWIWVPAHYCWSPRGYAFVDGYWDYSLARRGLLFAPVYFPRDVLARKNFVYTPSIVIDPTLLTTYLFTRPSFAHYYFGDYYAADNIKAGVYPWFAYHNSHYGYDPIYAHESWNLGRKDSNWLAGQRQAYWDRRDHGASRPPHTFAEQQKLARQPNANISNLFTTKPLADVARQKDHAVPLQHVDGQRLKDLTEHANQFRGVQQERRKWEGQPQAKSPTHTPQPKVEPKQAVQTPQKWQMPKPPSVIAPPKVQPKTPAAPQVPQHQTVVPKVTHQPLPKPEDQLKHPPAAPKNPNPKQKPKDK